MYVHIYIYIFYMYILITKRLGLYPIRFSYSGYVC